MLDLKSQRREETAQILEANLGSRWRHVLADALECDPSAIRRMFTPPKGRDDAPPVAMLACAEFLAATEPESWPDRWKAGVRGDSGPA